MEDDKKPHASLVGGDPKTDHASFALVGTAAACSPYRPGSWHPKLPFLTLLPPGFFLILFVSLGAVLNVLIHSFPRMERNDGDTELAIADAELSEGFPIFHCFMMYP